MRELPRAAIAYLLAVAALGTAVLAHAALGLELSAGRLPEVLLFVVLSTAADLNRLELKYSAGYSVATAINLASVIILGTDTAVWVSAIASAAGETWQRRPWYKVAFNTFNVAISVAAGGAVYDALRRSPVGTVAPADLPALLAYTIVNFLVNHALVCLVISLSTRARPWTVFTANYRSILIPALALFPIGVLLRHRLHLVRAPAGHRAPLRPLRGRVRGPQPGPAAAAADGGAGQAGRRGGRPARAGPAEERVPAHHLARAAHAPDPRPRLRRAAAQPRPDPGRHGEADGLPDLQRLGRSWPAW